MGALGRLIDGVKGLFAAPAPMEDEEEMLREDSAASIPARAVRPMEMLIYTPREYKDARYAVQSLNDGKTVVLRLMETDAETAQRILDFVSGAVYLVRGSMQLVGEIILIAAPSSVRLETGDHRLRLAEMPVFRGFNG